jgi:hypothetical protein
MEIGDDEKVDSVDHSTIPKGSRSSLPPCLANLISTCCYLQPLSLHSLGPHKERSVAQVVLLVFVTSFISFFK